MNTVAIGELVGFTPLLMKTPLTFEPARATLPATMELANHLAGNAGGAQFVNPISPISIPRLHHR